MRPVLARNGSGRCARTPVSQHNLIMNCLRLVRYANRPVRLPLPANLLYRINGIEGIFFLRQRTRKDLGAIRQVPKEGFSIFPKHPKLPLANPDRIISPIFVCQRPFSVRALVSRKAQHSYSL
jgi:hypothetical protein